MLTICKYLINGLLTNLQELFKCQYFTTCFYACNTVSCRHNSLTNCEILVCRLQSFSIVLNKIKITFTASHIYKLYICTNRHLNLDNTKAAYSNKSVFEFYLFSVILISFMHVIKPHVELHLINVISLQN